MARAYGAGYCRTNRDHRPQGERARPPSTSSIAQCFERSHGQTRRQPLSNEAWEFLLEAYSKHNSIKAAFVLIILQVEFEDTGESGSVAIVHNLAAANEDITRF